MGSYLAVFVLQFSIRLHADGDCPTKFGGLFCISSVQRGSHLSRQACQSTNLRLSPNYSGRNYHAGKPGFLLPISAKLQPIYTQIVSTQSQGFHLNWREFNIPPLIWKEFPLNSRFRKFCCAFCLNNWCKKLEISQLTISKPMPIRTENDEFQGNAWV